MTHTVGRNINVNSEATVKSPIILNTTTAVIVSDINASRIMFDVNNNDSAHGFWLRLYPAAQDNLKRGIFITNKIGSRPFWPMPNDNIYTGEISAIAETGNPAAYIIEY